jgi:hypothetical protein
MAVGMLIPCWGDSQALAQENGRFVWKRGQVLQYKVEQTTRATEVTSAGTSELSSRVEQTKSWRILDVTDAGIATVELSLLRLKMQQKLPSGSVLDFDSSNPDGSHQQLREQISPLIGKPLVVLRVDSAGKVVEVKASQQGPASRFESELPFIISLPGKPLQQGQTWSRTYRVVLDPPLGTGEKYAAEQTYQVRGVTPGQVTIAFATTLKDLPPSPAERLPLLQFQPKGEAMFDAKLGLILRARVLSGGVIEGHQGEGSRYEFSSDYREQLLSH